MCRECAASVPRVCRGCAAGVPQGVPRVCRQVCLRVHVFRVEGVASQRHTCGTPASHPWHTLRHTRGILAAHPRHTRVTPAAHSRHTRGTPAALSRPECNVVYTLDLYTQHTRSYVGFMRPDYPQAFRYYCPPFLLLLPANIVK